MSAAPTIDDPRYFDRLADVEARHWWARGMWRLASAWLDRALTGRRGLRALDVGCGAGLTALRLARRPEVAGVVGLDPSPEALTHARRRHDLPLLRGSALDLPLASGRFDLVTCFDVLQHLPPRGDRRAAVELARVLTPGGVALVRSNGRGWSRDTSAYRVEELTEVLSSAGLVVRRATYANCLPSLLQEVRGRVGQRLGADGGGQGARPHPSGGGLAIAVPRPWVNRLMGGISGGEALLAGRLGWRFPFGHSTLVLCEKRPG
jgi:SAM-dependent methyltransferase